MKNITAIIIGVLALLIIHPLGAQAQKPDYEKFGKMAITIVAADYPGNSIKDYEYLGRANINESDVADTFRFKVEEKGNTIYVKVIVQHNLTEEKAVAIRIVPEKRR